MSQDFSTLSDAELDAIIKGADVTQAPPGKGSEVLSARNAAVAETQNRLPKPLAEEIEPSAIKRGLAAFGGRLQEPVLGAAEKFELMFPGKNSVETIGADRAGRREALRQLEETTAGKFGGFTGQAAPFVLAAPTATAQATLAGGLGFLGGGPDKPTGAMNEMATSGFSGALDALGAGTATKGLQLVGKGVNAARGRYPLEGANALELDAAARRLGLPPTTIGQLDPLAPESLRAKPELALLQARALEERMQARRMVPNPEGGSMEQVVPGGRLKEGVKEAVDVRKGQGRDMYAAVDDFVTTNNLGNVTPNYTVNVLASANKLTPAGKAPTGNNVVYNLLDTYDPEAFSWLKMAGNPTAAKQQGMTMTQYHDARVAVGRSLNSLERKNPADLTAEQIEAKRILIDLKNALDNDVGRWAKTNSGNEEAMGLYNRAKDFYATTVADAVNNPLARKSVSVPRGFQSPELMYGAFANPNNRTLVERLMPTASPETRDMLNVLQNLPDVGKAVASRKVPSGLAEQELGALVRAGLGHPGLAAMEMAPGLRWLSSQRPTKKLYFGAEPTTRMIGPAAQYLSESPETWVREKTSTDRRPRSQ